MVDKQRIKEIMRITKHAVNVEFDKAETDNTFLQQEGKFFVGTKDYEAEFDNFEEALCCLIRETFGIQKIRIHKLGNSFITIYKIGNMSLGVYKHRDYLYLKYADKFYVLALLSNETLEKGIYMLKTYFNHR